MYLTLNARNEIRAKLCHISGLYDRIYDIADKIWKKYDPCQIKDNKCIGMHSGFEQLCCGDCKYWTKVGCNVKSLGCKLSYCFSEKRRVHIRV